MNKTWMFAGVLLELVFVGMVSFRRGAKRIKATNEGAKLAFKQLEEWAKWMAGVQLAAVGALAFRVFGDSKHPAHLYPWSAFLALSSFVMLGLGLFLAGTVLFSLASLSLRIFGEPDVNQPSQKTFDVFEQDIFMWLKIPLGYVTTLHWWLWALGLLSLGAYVTVSVCNLIIWQSGPGNT